MFHVVQVTEVGKAHMLFDFIEPLVKDVDGLTENVDDEVLLPLDLGAQPKPCTCSCSVSYC